MADSSVPAMKASILLPLAAVCVMASAEPIPEILTLSGKTYRQCEIVRVYPDGVAFRHADGAAKVLFEDLSKEWRERLGYDAAKAAAYRKELADKRAAEREARARVEEARFKALAEAAEMARTRSLGQEAQARASIQVQGNAIVSPAVPAMPALGAVHDPLAGYGRYERPHAFPYWQGGWGGYPGYGWGWGASFYTPGWGISVSPVPFCPTPRIFRSTITR